MRSFRVESSKLLAIGLLALGGQASAEPPQRPLVVFVAEVDLKLGRSMTLLDLTAQKSFDKRRLKNEAAVSRIVGSNVVEDILRELACPDAPEAASCTNVIALDGEATADYLTAHLSTPRMVVGIAMVAHVRGTYEISVGVAVHDAYSVVARKIAARYVDMGLTEEQVRSRYRQSLREVAEMIDLGDSQLAAGEVLKPTDPTAAFPTWKEFRKQHPERCLKNAPVSAHVLRQTDSRVWLGYWMAEPHTYQITSMGWLSC
jgi:hypothetical protein